MNERTFTYRTGGALVVALFFFVWGLGAGLGGGLSALNGSLKMNGRLIDASDSVPYFAGFAFVGLCAISIGMRFLLSWINERVVLTQSEVTWIDCLGREKLKSTRSGIKPVAGFWTSSSSSQGATAFKTSNGELRIGRAISDFAVLKDLLISGATLVEAIDEPPVHALPVPLYKPEAKTYRYSGSVLHIFSFVWLGLICFMAVMFVTSGQMEKSTSITFPILMFAVLACFAGIGIWMQLTGWIEQITLGPDGIRWVDFLGRVKVQASLSEIRSIDRVRGNISVLKIYTTNGVVQCSGYLWGFENLLTEVSKVLESRPART